MRPEQHAPRPKFDTLFAEPRHYRSDCRLVVTAIRRGWLDDAPQADRDALAARFQAVTSERWATDPDTRSVRAFFAECAVLLTMEGENIQRERYLAAADRFGPGGVRATGRPRERWYVSDHPGRLDAAKIQREQTAAGHNPLDIVSLSVTLLGDGVERPQTVALVAMPDQFRRVKLWLVCPRCQRRRAHLFPTNSGVVCRRCGGIGYRDHRA